MHFAIPMYLQILALHLPSPLLKQFLDISLLHQVCSQLWLSFTNLRGFSISGIKCWIVSEVLHAISMHFRINAGNLVGQFSVHTHYFLSLNFVEEVDRSFTSIWTSHTGLLPIQLLKPSSYNEPIKLVVFHWIRWF